MEQAKSRQKSVFLAFGLVVGSLIVWAAIDVFLLAFAAILFAIFLNAVGNWAKKITRLPYPLALCLGIVCILGFLALIFWFYSPLIALQFQNLVEQLPGAFQALLETLAPFLGKFVVLTKLTTTFLLDNKNIVEQVTKIFSFTMGSIIGFVIFLVVGLYLALDPEKYVRGMNFLVRANKNLVKAIEKSGQALRWWLMGKIVAMISIGILTFIGLWLLNVPLALILGFLAGILAFIPYIGPILSSIPAILIAFTQSPLMTLYVVILYLGIHALEGYLLTPFIEQKTVSIPPALTIMTQILLVVLMGGLGLALATPLTVVTIALLQSSD